MFKNMVVYRMAPTWQADLQQVEQALQKAVFLPCTATQESACGWVPARGQAHGPLVESVGGQWILRFRSESKLLPASVLQRRVAEKCAEIEQATGRSPGKKEQRALKDEARLDLLPRAFTQDSSLWVWIDPVARVLVVDASAQSKADAVVSNLVEHLNGLALALLDTQTSAQAAMAQWLLSQEAPAEFSIDQACTLKAQDGSKAVVRYAHHALDIDEVAQHIQQGKLPSQLALTWQGRVSFELTEALHIKKIVFQDPVQDASQEEGGFDGDVALATGELSQLIPALVQALGGEGRTALEALETAPAASAEAKQAPQPAVGGVAEDDSPPF